jgi:hypothetical protein
VTRILAATPVWRDHAFVIAAQQAMLDASPVEVAWWRVGSQTYPPPDNRNIAVIYNAAVQKARAGGYSHLLTLEDDIVPPFDALTKLLAADAPVAYSVYCWRRTKHHWSLYRTLMADSGASWSDDEPHTAIDLARQGAVVDVAGVGNGCTLFDLRVFDRLTWRVRRRNRFAQDWNFAVDAQRAGVRQAGHFGVLCGHVDKRWGVIWPDPAGDPIRRTLYRYEPMPEGAAA